MNIPGFVVEDRTLAAEPGLTKEQYAEACKLMAAMEKIYRTQMPWWVGDLVNIGEDLFADEVYQMLEFDDISTSHLARRSRIARLAGPEARRATERWDMVRLAAMHYRKHDEMLEAIREAEDEGLTLRAFKAKLKGRKDYKSRAAVQESGRTKKYDRLVSEFDDVFDKHSQNWLASPSNREMARKIFKHALEVAGL